MTDPLFQSLYSEEIYQLPPKPTVILGHPWKKISEAEQQLLLKILGSIKLNLDSVSILEQAQFDLSTWAEKPKHIICFSPAAVSLAKYEIIEVGSTAVVLSHSLQELIPDDVSKRKLWLILKQMFSI